MEIDEKTVRSWDGRYHFPMYNRFPVTLVEGSGAVVRDMRGKEYVDCLAGIAVNCLGYGNPAMVEAVCEQSRRLMHTSNLFYTVPQARLARRLVELSGLDRVFFCNSGAEAVEGAVKLARKHSLIHGRGRKIISLENCFHGRTIATVTMGKAKYHDQFRPLPPGFEKVPFNNVPALRDSVGDGTAAVIIEPVQGEGGIHTVSREFMAAAREVCDRHGALLILDEIQCGAGRTGRFFAYEHYGITPDVVTMAKGLGGGFPIGAVLATESAASAFEPGDHGTTFGGNPLACAVADSVVETIATPGMMESVTEKGRHLMESLRGLAETSGAIAEVRGIGLMVGVELECSAPKVVSGMIDRGVLANYTSERVLRMVPPFVITTEQLDAAVRALAESLKEVCDGK